MMQRSILILPKFEEERRIESLRKKYDPLYGLIKPHITLVFPFYSALTSEALKKHISSVLERHSPFFLKMQGISAHQSVDASYMFLNVIEGEAHIRSLSRDLYCDILSAHQSAAYSSYTPHITLGKFLHAADLEAAMHKEKHWRHSFHTTISTIHVEIISEDNASTIEASFAL